MSDPCEEHNVDPDEDDAHWYCDLHTAEDIRKARMVLMFWAEQTGNLDASARMTELITRRAIELGLEKA